MVYFVILGVLDLLYRMRFYIKLVAWMFCRSGIFCFMEVAMKKVHSVLESLPKIDAHKEREVAAEAVKRECQVLWKTLCEADPEENMFTSSAYKKFMNGCVAKLGHI